MAHQQNDKIMGGIGEMDKATLFALLGLSEENDGAFNGEWFGSGKILESRTPIDGSLIGADWGLATVAERQTALEEHLAGNGDSRYAVASLNDESNALLGYNGLNVDAPNMAAGMTDGGTLTIASHGRKLLIDGNPISRIVFAHMDGKTSLRDLHEKIRQQVPGTNIGEIRREIQKIYETLNPHAFVYLIKAGNQGARMPVLADIVKKSGRSQPVPGRIPDLLLKHPRPA